MHLSGVDKLGSAHSRRSLTLLPSPVQVAAAGDCDSGAPGSERLGGKYARTPRAWEFRARVGTLAEPRGRQARRAHLSVRVRVGVCYCVCQPRVPCNAGVGPLSGANN